MPPAAATIAGRRSTRSTAATSAPQTPRRVSGPAIPAETATEARQRARPAVRPSNRAAAAAAALEAQLVSAPVRLGPEAPARTAPLRTSPPRPSRREAPGPRRDATRQRTQVRSVPRLALRLRAPRLDRIVRGRAWIPVLGVLLFAIVGLRVEVLKLGASVGSEVQQATQLQSANAALRTQISALSDNQRITRLAASYGMRNPDALEAHFLQATVGHHVAAAIRNISAPSRSNFLTGLVAEVQTDQLSAQAGSSLSAVGGQPASGTPLSTTSTTTSSGTTSSGTTGSVTTDSVTSGAPSSTGYSTPSTSGVTSAPSADAGGSGSTASSLGAAAPTSSGSSVPSSGNATTDAAATGSSTGATSSGGTVSDTSSSGLPSSTPPVTASANGAAGIGG